MTTEASAHDLPHGFPFRLVDRVLELRPGRLCVAERAVTGGEFHAPRTPSLPGATGPEGTGEMPRALLVEMLCQTCALAAGAAGPGAADGPGPRGPGRLAGLRGFRFGRAPRAGDRVTLRAEQVQALGEAARFEVRALCGEELLAEGQILVSTGGGER